MSHLLYAYMYRAHAQLHHCRVLLAQIYSICCISMHLCDFWHVGNLSFHVSEHQETHLNMSVTAEETKQKKLEQKVILTNYKFGEIV